MVNYDDITQTLLIERIKIQYDSNSQWNKYLKYSLRNPHSFIFPDIPLFNNFNKDFNYFNSTFLSKGYKINNIDKLNKDYNEGGSSEKYLFEIEKYEEKNFREDNDALIRKIVYLFKECMYYFMSFNENDGQILEKRKNSNKKDINHSSEYELFKSLNDCIIQLHDSKKKKNQALIMTSEFCGVFTPKYVKLTKYSDQFKNLLKENNINFIDLFNEEIQNNEFYKKKKEHFDHLKNSSFVPLTKGEISLANKNNITRNNLIIKKKIEENNNIENEHVDRVLFNNEVDPKSDKYKKEETFNKAIVIQNENDLNVKKKEKKEKKKRKKNECSENKKYSSTNLNTSMKDNCSIPKETNDTNNNEECDNSKKKKRMRKSDEKKKYKNKVKNNEKIKESICKDEVKELDMVLYENEEIYNYLNIKNENTDVNKNENFMKNTKIFNLLNKKMNSDDYIYKEIKSDFMKEINLPNNFNYDVNVIEINEKDIKNFYRCIVRYINKKKEKLKIYYIISNFLFFFSKMHKNCINFDDNVHKDINRNFDYKSIVIQGNILPYNFFLLLKALHLMSSYDIIKNFYITVNYDERKNKCLHFLNLTENRFYENFKKFEKNIKSNFMYVHKFLQNMIPVNKYLITKGKLHKNMENTPFSFENNDLLQITYNKSYDNRDIVLYEENNEDYTDENNTIGNNLNTINNNSLSNYNYLIYDSNNIHKQLLNIKNYCKIIDDKEMHKIMKDLTDFNDNYTKILLRERKILFLLDLYEKKFVFQNLMLNSIFFDSYISLIYIYYINNYTKNIDNVRHIPLFKPSYINLLVHHIIKKKNEKKLKKTKTRNVHTVDKLCNNFFKNSFNKILNAKIEERTDNTSLNNLKKEEIKQDSKGETLENDDNKYEINNNSEYHQTDVYLTDGIKKNETKIVSEKNHESNIQISDSSLIINEAVIRKKEYDNLVICIFVFINENSHSFSEEEKEIRELILYVLKTKENSTDNNEIKYSFKYRNSINDAITLSEIEIRKNDYCQIYIIGLVLNNDISNQTLQTDINNLYNLNQTLHQKYNAINFEIKTKIFTFYWIYQVHIYGSVFLKNKEINHMIKKVDNTYQLPYNVQWKSKLLWGYYLYIIQDSVNSNYTNEMIEKLNEEGINIKLCSEEFDAKVVENDINEILNLHDLELNDLKYIDNNIFMNIIFLIENGHLTYFTFINTDNINITQRNNYISIQIFKSKVTFPSFNLNTPLLNDTWLKDVLSKQTLLPFNDYFYKF
ncbi:translation initiation factor EIF-2B subunit related [Plasmodium relictum]|uniref:Translation initiation factor EIF-2B subunit related n=1 Tax=Plasmodium relictum TaxID=85471 RepID=A0A1J1H880_PLARL|nr:translation initiation factor EIF-2B subunit related [Plasmodium relictum]CRH01176.1 translation initiation factor EIF-2B subunit related [Plasmodium relictum]